MVPLPSFERMMVRRRGEMRSDVRVDALAREIRPSVAEKPAGVIEQEQVDSEWESFEHSFTARIQLAAPSRDRSLVDLAPRLLVSDQPGAPPQLFTEFEASSTAGRSIT